MHGSDSPKVIGYPLVVNDCARNVVACVTSAREGRGRGECAARTKSMIRTRSAKGARFARALDSLSVSSIFTVQLSQNSRMNTLYGNVYMRCGFRIVSYKVYLLSILGHVYITDRNTFPSLSRT